MKNKQLLNKTGECLRDLFVLLGMADDLDVEELAEKLRYESCHHLVLTLIAQYIQITDMGDDNHTCQGKLSMGGTMLNQSETKSENKKMKIIKRYQNRKLYDTQQSCYVNHTDIIKMIRTGEEVMVIDNKSKNDITAATLTQIIFEAEKKASQYAPLSILREIIQHKNSSISSYLINLRTFSYDNIKVS
jgi:polyhydroxyalkanoate synthesis repressor PhaR